MATSLCKIAFLFFVLSLTSAIENTRPDGLCGPNNLASSGLPAECQYIDPFPTCCQNNGYCGWDCKDEASTVDLTVNKPVQYESTGLYRSDGRCGPLYPAADGVTPAECDPNSGYYCCSADNFCGSSHDHCFCDTCVSYRPLKINNEVRSDRRCGLNFPLPNGSYAECDGNSDNHCCSVHGYCGPGDAHCGCVGCVDFREKDAKFDSKPPAFVNENVRADRRCGSEYPVANGVPGECDPNSANPCCSKWGYCGPGAEHCDCPTCKDFRNFEQKVAQDFVGKVRRDRRCGPMFPLPGSNEPSICDGNSSNFCCSKWGYCGFDSEHCDCPECVNYKHID